MKHGLNKLTKDCNGTYIGESMEIINCTVHKKIEKLDPLEAYANDPFHPGTILFRESPVRVKINEIVEAINKLNEK